MEEARILVCPSGNVEVSVTNGDPKLFGRYGLNPGEKNLVRKIISQSSRQVGEKTFTIRTGYGKELFVTGTNVNRIPAGGAVNVAFVLNSLGWKETGVLIPAGEGRDGEFLKASLASRGINSCFLLGKGTAFTLTLRHANGSGSTLFCQKPEYEVGENVESWLNDFRPKILLAASVKPIDLGLVESLYQRPDLRLRVLMPHEELLGREDMRARLVSVIQKSDLLQLNDKEASVFLGKEFTATNINQLAKFGATMTVVTMAEKGAVLAAEGRALEQEAFPVRKVVDTSGAGDTFLAAFVYYRWLFTNNNQKLPLGAVLRMAAWVAAKKVSEVGPWSGIPSEEERSQVLGSWF